VSSDLQHDEGVLGLPWIDTHCHMDAGEFAQDLSAVLKAASAAGVKQLVLPAVDIHNFDRVREIANQVPGGRYALGIHPMCSKLAGASDLERLDAALSAAADDPKLVAVGEIGIDLFMDDLKAEDALKHQEWLFGEQLRLARRHHLPVLVHIRRAQDRVLKCLRAHPGVVGIAHAFNGSRQQADQFIDLGFKLGMGGAMTFDRALNIRRIARGVALAALVLETDSPDISPAWLHPKRNTPAEIPAIGRALAELRGVELQEIALETASNARRVLTRL
jgi:TatD DNase family protein